MPPITLGLIIALIILLLAILGLLSVLPLNPLIVFGMIAGLALARVV